MAGRVVLVVVSPRVPPGLLSWPAWEALRSGPVLTGAGPTGGSPTDAAVTGAASPQLPFLRDAGIDVEVVPTPDAAARESLAADLHERAAAGETVVWLTTGDEDAELVRALGLRAVRSGVVLEQVHGSYDPPGARLLDVVAVMDRLRSPGGCPWDAQQTHASLKPYLLEEAYEAYQALEDGHLGDLREELGDVLLQVAFHSRLAEEAEQPWSIDDVAGDLVDKLVRRHPHVFAGGSADDLEGSWEALKTAEKGRASVTDGVPLGQPALSLAAKLQRRAARLGAPVELGAPVQLGEPVEPGEGPTGAPRAGVSGARRGGATDGAGGTGPAGVPGVGPGQDLGTELWRLVSRCRDAGLDPEVELRAVARAYRDRLASLEAAVRTQGRDPADLTEQEWAARWS